MPLRRLVALVALAGFMACVVANISSALELAMPYRAFTRFLVLMLVVVWLLTVYDMRGIAKGRFGVWYWRYAVEGGPRWFAGAIVALHVYLGLCCALRLLYVGWAAPSLRGVGSLFFVGSSALMVAYGTAAMAEYSAIRRCNARS